MNSKPKEAVNMWVPFTQTGEQQSSFCKENTISADFPLISSQVQDENCKQLGLSPRDTNARESYATISQENSRLRSQIQHYQQRMEEFSRQISMFRSEQQRFHLENNGLRDTVEDLKIHKIKSNRLREENSRLVQEMQRLQEENVSLRSQETVLHQYKSLLDSYSDIQHIAESSDELENGRASNDTSEGRVSNEQRIQDMDSTIQLQTTQIHKLEEKCLSASHRSDELQNQLNNAAKQARDVSEINAKYSKEIESLRIQNEELVEELASLQMRSHEMQESNDRYVNEIKILKIEIGKLKHQNNKKRPEILLSSEDNVIPLQIIKENVSQDACNEEEMSLLRHEIATLHDELSHYQSQEEERDILNASQVEICIEPKDNPHVVERDREIEVLKQSKKELENELIHTQEQLFKMQSSNESSKPNVPEIRLLEQEVQQYKHQNKSWRQRTHQTEAELSQIQKQIVTIEKQLERAKNRCHTVEIERDKMHTTIIKIRDENEQIVAQLKREIKHLQNKNQSKCACSIL